VPQLPMRRYHASTPRSQSGNLVTLVLPYGVIDVREYLAADGSSPYAKWFNALNGPAAAKVAIAITRMAQGNFSNAKSVGGGIQEYRIDFGPGYRIYFGRDGERLVILLGGGTKKRQQDDIYRAQNLWADYKRRRKKGEM
jgi:putative addiction module killer protein